MHICTECNKKFKTIGTLSRHREKYHTTKSKLTNVVKKSQKRPRKLRTSKKGTCTVSKLEDRFALILDSTGVVYTRQYSNGLISAFYDFHLTDTDTYIEVHGDYWHCKPGTQHAKAKYHVQRRNLKNDKRKKHWCDVHGKTLLIFWESDINSNALNVKHQIVDFLKNTP